MEPSCEESSTLIGRSCCFTATVGLVVRGQIYPDVVFKKWIRCLGDPIIILIILTEIEPATALKRLYARLGFVLLPLSVLYIKYYPEIGRAYSNSWEYMFRGVCDHKNTLGTVCCVLGLGFLWRFLDHWQNKADPRQAQVLIGGQRHARDHGLAAGDRRFRHRENLCRDRVPDHSVVPVCDGAAKTVGCTSHRSRTVVRPVVCGLFRQGAGHECRPKPDTDRAHRSLESNASRSLATP